MRRVAARFAAILVLAGCTLSAAADSTLRWPRSVTTPAGDRVTLSSLQVDEWRERTLFAKCVASVQLHGATSATIGTITLQATTTFDRSDRIVVLSEITLPAMRFLTDAPGIIPISTALSAAIVGSTLRVPLDELFATMSATSFTQRATEPSSAPPCEVRLALLLTAEPALFEPIVAKQLDGCSNARAPLFRTDGGVFYLLAVGQWYSSDTLTSGAWQWVAPSTLPAALNEISESSQWASALSHLPASALGREATQLAAISPPPPSVDADSLAGDPLLLWWNPWEGSWWSSGESVASRGARLRESAAVADPWTIDPSREDFFVGLDGRIYALRNEMWFRTTPQGGWSEFTELRSTMRVLKDFSRARAAASERRKSYESWRTAQAARDLSSPTTSSTEAISMKDFRPTSDGMRQVVVAPAPTQP